MKLFSITILSILSISQCFSQTQSNCEKLKTEIGQLKEENLSLRNSLKIGEPIKEINYDNINFKLIGLIGDNRSQTVTFTFKISSSLANWYIRSAIRSIIDIDGNEFKLKSYVNGTNDNGSTIYLNTDVPMKCNYTFEGILPTVKVIKLMKFNYSHNSDSKFVEFRDLTIDWR